VVGYKTRVCGVIKMKFYKFLEFIGATEDQAQSIWYLLSGRNMRAVVDDQIVQSGTWRWTSGMLADYFGTGSYMTYYCGGSGQCADDLEEHLKGIGVEFIPIPD